MLGNKGKKNQFKWIPEKPATAVTMATSKNEDTKNVEVRS
jgi:hypothetical protein